MFKSGAGEMIDSCGRKLHDSTMPAAIKAEYSPELGTKRPLVLVVDKALAIRMYSLKPYLTAEGATRRLIALRQRARGVHHVLNMFTPQRC